MIPSAKEGSYESQSLPGRNPKSATVQAIALQPDIDAPEDRIHIPGNGLVQLRDVLAAIQPTDPKELAVAFAKAR
jgi:hypothetical protein